MKKKKKFNKLIKNLTYQFQNYFKIKKKNYNINNNKIIKLLQDKGKIFFR